MTNYEKIKSMSVDEMAKMLCTMNGCHPDCIADDLCDIEKENGFIKYLEREGL